MEDASLRLRKLSKRHAEIDDSSSGESGISECGHEWIDEPYSLARCFRMITSASRLRSHDRMVNLQTQESSNSCMVSRCCRVMSDWRHNSWSRSTAVITSPSTSSSEACSKMSLYVAAMIRWCNITYFDDSTDTPYEQGTGRIALGS